MFKTEYFLQATGGYGFIAQLTAHTRSGFILRVQKEMGLLCVRNVHK